MYRFWEPVVEPLLTRCAPGLIVEIGSDLGYNTSNLLDFCRRNGAVLHAIDPLPKFDVEAWEREYDEELTLHRLTSLEVLPKLPKTDAVLIDGDHNWYTVFHELKALEENARSHGDHFPLVFLHDIGWPYGRRDLYYDPDRIPEPYRHSYRMAGLRPSRSDLDTAGGLNTHLHNAVEEGGPRNGVLTAIEDFLERTPLDLDMVTVPGIHDLGIIVSRDLKAENDSLSQFLDEIAGNRALREVASQVESLRVAAVIDRADQLKKLDSERVLVATLRGRLAAQEQRVEAEWQPKVNRLTQALDAEKTRGTQLRIRNKSLDQDRAHIHAQSKRLRQGLASLQKKNDQLQGNVNDLAKRLTLEQEARKNAAAQLKRLKNRRIVKTAVRVGSLAKPAIRAWRRIRRLAARTPSSGALTGSPTEKAVGQDRDESMRETGTADIVVCVHNAEEDVRNCLESIVETTNLVTHGLIVVDDGSDTAVRLMLERFASTYPVQLIRNETAQGYTVAANQGIAVSERPHVVLLNSDTVVTPGWLEKLVQCAETMPDTGIVGPFSNAASWQSLPELTNADGSWHLNPLSEGVTPADIAAQVSRWSPRIYPEVPLVNGFCYLITRSALDQVGTLDEKSFPRGYGEEDDFSIRCSDLGLKLYIADDCYVYHAKSRSHTPEGRKAIVRENKVVLQRKHGAESVAERVDRIRRDEDLIRSRTFVSGAIRKTERPSPPTITGSPVVGWLQPHLEEAGGIRRAIEMTNRLSQWGFESVIIAPDGWKSDWLPILSRVVSVDEARSMSFDHLILSDPDIVWPFLEIEATRRVIYHLAPYMLYRNTDETLQAYYESTKDSLHVANSKWTAEQVQEYSGLTIEGVFPGGVDKRLFHPMRVGRTHDVVCHGSNRRHKGTDTIEEASSGMGVLKMDTLGAPQRHLARLINSGRVFVSAAWHEGFNLAALEAMACGVPVVMTDDGGSRDYAVNEQNALVVEPRNPSALREQILRLQKDESLRASLIAGGLQTVWQYDWDSVTSDFVDLVLGS